MIDLKRKEQEILATLKDFQLATVERVDSLFRSGYRRVLVADEVGLGKTLVAKGLIARMARYYQQERKKELFKVVYVCSNQSIAGQNLKKLKFHDEVTVDGLSDTRLSMQHLKIFEQMNNEKIKAGFVQLIPLTPGTSFSMTSGTGSVLERALMFAILKRLDFFQPYLTQLTTLMMSKATKSWLYREEQFEKAVLDCDIQSKSEYLRYMTKTVREKIENDQKIKTLAEQVFKSIEAIGYRDTPNANKLILLLRKIMAEISVEIMEADLVIMDEFQRFPELLKLKEEDETTLLARKFFSPDRKKEDHPYILLLSATPYKLYSTMEEIQETREDEHYKEFNRVMQFLFEHRPELSDHFSSTWKNYSLTLNEATFGNLALVVARKREAEDCLYQGMCRTERLKVPGSYDLIELENRNEPLKIHEDDVLAYVKIDRLLAESGLKGAAPVEYIKSAPLIMSFMHHYKLKQKLQDRLKAKPEKLPLARHRQLWVNRDRVASYKPLKVNHARLNKLQEHALPAGAEKLLWIPPAKPYYDLRGPFKNQEGFSKTLVFSAWEMVPRAIAALLSYEAERLTVGKLVQQTPKTDQENRSYFAKKRFPAPRIRFAVKNNEPDNMNHLCLLYPSVTLATLYDPIDCLNRKLSYREVRREVTDKIQERLEELDSYVQPVDQVLDQRWYYLAPLLMDQHEPAMAEWFQSPVLRNLVEGQEGVDQQEEDRGALMQHLHLLKKLYDNPGDIVLGRKPRDLEEVLVDMVMASPAVCALRMLGMRLSGSVDLSLQLSRTIVDRFNTQESIAMVDLSYGKTGEGVHWKSILKYCLDGNLQAVLDEYTHMLLEGMGASGVDPADRNEPLIKEMISTLKTHTASYNVDTYQKFRDHVLSQGKRDQRNRYIRMRSSYAVGFYDTKNEGKSNQRKDNIRLSFNSPFRPFVLATTSIGQEGLDFHYYCRKIVHWNLPGNPIDLEQREGRINRYKGHAIRQNIADKYGDIFFREDICQEMFDQAEKMEKNADTSDLVPFWSLSEQEGNRHRYKIERIVPIYPMSRDSAKYERLMKVLSLYRLSLGQARQEELIEYLFENDFGDMSELFMNLSPYFKE